MMRNHLPKGGYDVFLSDIGDYYYVDISTDKGDQIVAHSGLFEPVTADAEKSLSEMRERKKQIFKSEVPIRYQDIPRLFEETFESDVWHQLGDRCVSCGNCTNVCPTCYCFDVIDEPELDATKGRRYRVWDSCQNEDFAKIAGGESFGSTAMIVNAIASTVSSATRWNATTGSSVSVAAAAAAAAWPKSF